MDQPTFDVVFDGDLIAGKSLHEVELLLARSLRIGVEQVHAMLAQGAATLQSDVGQVAAERWVEAFRQAGVLCRLVPHGAVSRSGGACATDAPMAPLAPIVPVRSAPGSSAEARPVLADAGRHADAAGPIAPIVPSRAVPEAATPANPMSTRPERGRPVPQDPPPVSLTPSPASPPPSPIVPAPVIVAAGTRTSQSSVGGAAASSQPAPAPPVETGAAEPALHDIPDLRPHRTASPLPDATVPACAATPDTSRDASEPVVLPPDSNPELPFLTTVEVGSDPIPLVATDATAASPDGLAPPASIPLGDLPLEDVRLDLEPGATATPSADSLVQRLVGSSDPDPDLRAGQASASPHLLELDQGDPAAVPIELDTNARVAVPVGSPQHLDDPASGSGSALPPSRQRPVGAYPPGNLAPGRRMPQDSSSRRSSRAGLMMGSLIAVIVGVGAVMAGGGAILSRQADPAGTPEDQPSAGATRVEKWEVQFTTATRFIVSYQCDDGVPRNIVCWSPIRDQYECTCYRDGYEGQRFETQGVPTTTAEARTLAQQRCEWKLVD